MVFPLTLMASLGEFVEGIPFRDLMTFHIFPGSSSGLVEVRNSSHCLILVSLMVSFASVHACNHSSLTDLSFVRDFFNLFLFLRVALTVGVIQEVVFSFLLFVLPMNFKAFDDMISLRLATRRARLFSFGRSVQEISQSVPFLRAALTVGVIQEVVFSFLLFVLPMNFNAFDDMISLKRATHRARLFSSGRSVQEISQSVPFLRAALTVGVIQEVVFSFLLFVLPMNFKAFDDMILLKRAT